MDGSAIKPLGRWERCGLSLFVLLLCALGGLVEYRSAFLTRRMGDLDVFLRAAWAVRNGEDLYQVTSDNDWHYIYPPLYAILMTPLADPPRDADPAGYLAYPVSVAICYLLNLLCLFVGVHLLASALEERIGVPSFATQPRYCRRWWALRVLPVLVCFLPIGHTMMRGQVNVIVLASLCAALAGWIRGQSFRAGAWLALAICIKVIPAFLLVYPIWKRDGRAVAGCALGLFLGLGLIPVLAFGPERTVTHYETYGRVFFGPFLKLSEDDSRKEEILGGVNATESVGVRNALHNWMHPDPNHRPAELTFPAKLTYLLLGIAMTFVTLWPRSDRALRVAQGFGALILLMAIFSPVCHSHYLLFCVPLVMSLLANAWKDRADVHVPWPLVTTFTLFTVTMAIAYLPGMEILKDRCASLFATLPMWGIPIWQLWREANTRPVDARIAPLESSRKAA